MQLRILSTVEPRTRCIDRLEGRKCGQRIQHTDALGIAQDRFDVAEMDLEGVDRKRTLRRRQLVQVVADVGVRDIGNLILAKMRHQIRFEPCRIKLELLL